MSFWVLPVHSMSVPNYFTKNKECKAKERVSGKEYDSIKDTLDLHPENKKRRITYKEE